MANDFTTALKKDRASEANWDRWFRAIYPRVYFVMFRMCGGDRYLAEDLVQGALENFIVAKAIEKVTSDAEATGYLLRTARNLFVDRLRYQKGKVQVTNDVDEIADPKSRQTEDKIALEQIAVQLEEDEQVLLKLIRAGKSIREVAAHLGLGYSAAGVRVHRLRERMRKLSESM